MKAKKLIVTAVVTLSLVALSAGLVACNPNKPGYYGVTAQADIFTELNAMTADAGILDYTMASYLLGQNTAITRDLAIVDSIDFDLEQYGIAVRKGSTGLLDKINSALAALEDTKVAEIASTYGMTNNLLSLDYTPTDQVDNTDWNYIVGKGTFIVGYTLNPPMAMKETGTDNLYGFDIDLPKALVQYLNQTYGINLEIRFQLINWDNKIAELDGKTIDCIWNGMTIKDEYNGKMEISTPYLINKQCVVVRKADVEKYATADSLKNARVVAERGSAGADIAEALFK